MIDTDKYEGRTPNPWIVNEGSETEEERNRGEKLVSSLHPNEYGLESDIALVYSGAIDARLIADIPLILEAYKELQDYHAALLHWVMYHMDKDEDEVKEMIYE